MNINDAANGNHLPCHDGNGNVVQVTKASDGSVSAQYEYGAFGEVIRATGPMAKANPFRYSTRYQDDETDRLCYGCRYYNASIGRWFNRDPVAEEGGVNLYGFVNNTPINAIDVLGFRKRTVRYVGKSFINGIGPLGSLGNRAGLPFPPVILSSSGVDLGSISGKGQYADQRLAVFASLIPTIAHALWLTVGQDYDPFNQNPISDAKDGIYRLYGKLEITARCCSGLLFYSTKNDMEGGKEVPGISGTINMSVNSERPFWGFDPRSVILTWKTWGHPNWLAEPGMQWVGYRWSVNIWHEGKVKVTCDGDNPTFSVLSFRGSRYPSRRLWENGTMIKYIAQGSFSDLWRSQPGNPTFVAE